MNLHSTAILVLATAALLAPTRGDAARASRSSSAADGRIPVLILTGENRTDWSWSSTHMRGLLEASGRFHVEVAVVPEAALSDADYVDRFELFLVDYAGARWGEQAEANFLKAVEAGAGVVALADAVAAFEDWKAYEDLIGFRRGEYAYRMNLQQVEVTLESTEHPINAGLERTFLRQDQLPVGLELADAKEHTVIATMRGADGRQPQPAMVVGAYGEGRVFASPLGYVAEDLSGTRSTRRDPASEMLLLRICEWAATGQVSSLKRMAPNTLTAADRAAGWKLLFDGASGKGWVSGRKVGLPAEGWRVAGGVLHVRPEAGADGIATEEAFREFELELDWRIDGEGSGELGFSRGGSFELGAGDDPASSLLRPPGEWNHCRFVATHQSVQHWLNGVRQKTIYNDPAQWAERMSEGNLEQDPELSKMPMTNIVLRGNGAAVSMRNFRIRRLPLPVPEESRPKLRSISLFNGRDLEGWTWVEWSRNRNDQPAFHVDAEGHLINTGNPAGYLISSGVYQDYELDFDWRFNPINKFTGAGDVLLRWAGENLDYPDALAVHLAPGNAGGLRRQGSFELTADRRRTAGEEVRVMRNMENRSGQWNHMQVSLDGGDLVVRVNGEVVNAASDISRRPGRISIVPLGIEIQFRGIALRPLR